MKLDFIPIWTIATVALLLGLGCDRDESSSRAASETPFHPDRPASPAAEPGEPTAPASRPVKGEVTETMDVARYTYLQVKTSDGAHWVAVPQMEIETGAEVEISGYNVMRDFHSNSLNKTFPEILFASQVRVVGEEGQPSHDSRPAAEGMPPGHPPVGSPSGTEMPAGHPPVESPSGTKMPAGHPPVEPTGGSDLPPSHPPVNPEPTQI